ncbi:MAG TPA: sugar transferase [Blastocatellia bacterium]|nr:sugar transferase [Blastocatellia bacterium]
MPAPYRKLYLLYLKLMDLVLMVGAVGLTITLNYAREDYFRYALDFMSERIRISNALLVGLLVFVWHQALNLRGLYLLTRLHLLGEEVREIALAVGSGAVALLVVARVGNWPTITLWTAGSWALLSFLLICGFRLAQQYALRWVRRRGHNAKTMLLVGGGPRGQQFVARLMERPDLGYRLLGYVDSDHPRNSGPLQQLRRLGGLEELPAIITTEVVDEVVIALPIKSHYEQIERVIALLEEQGITVHLLMDFFSRRRAHYRAARLQGIEFISLQSAPSSGWRAEIKRLVDLSLAVVMLVALLPLFALVAVMIKLDSAGPVFFIQTRMGWNKRRFQLFKFRTMVVNAEAQMKEVEHLNEKEGPIFKIKNDPRVTRVGRWLRKTSIDELPQLINVILGDMSLVGPRPLSMRDACGLDAVWQKRRFSVKPGITCLWQVSGRSNLSFREWMLLDLEYIDRWSLSLDFHILLRTIPAVLSGRGAA